MINIYLNNSVIYKPKLQATRPRSIIIALVQKAPLDDPQYFLFETASEEVVEPKFRKRIF